MATTSELSRLAVEYEGMIRLVAFAAIFAAMLLWEWFAPRRPLAVARAQRWSSNLGLMVINTVALRLLFPAAAVGFALSAEALGFGLFHWLAWPPLLELVLGVLLLDLAIYGQHLLMHRVPLLWRLHRVHHADLDFDLTTAVRFHTLEILLSMLIKWGVILLLGPAVLAVLIFEVLLNGMAVFNHANVSLPARAERAVRALLVTPDMHRVHHSAIMRETNSNYGFNLSLWDRLFGTYTAQPAQGHDGMTIGLEQFRDADQVDRLPGMLALPFGKR